ncbi:tetratricopeptide repeat protein [Labilibacter marinus]|uniref:tetratricopeptide repeat protein n=1 Tax=Labilibacter marinus TaxID=1477105 RepID=UPI0009502359|nr:tetratricopeptide repeat protein [Labilibacter marinus]
MKFILIICFLSAVTHVYAAPIDAENRESKEYVDSVKAVIQNVHEEDVNAPKLLLSLYKELGSTFQKEGLLDSALYYYSLGEQLISADKNDSIYASLIYNKGLVFYQQGKHKKALEYSLQSLSLDKELADKKAIVASLNNVALAYQAMGIYDKALEYRLQSIKQISDEESVDMAIANYNLGSLYLKLNKHEQAWEYLILSQKLLKKTQIQDKENEMAHPLSECIYSMGNVKLVEKQYEQAIELFQEAAGLKQIINDDKGLGSCYDQIGLALSLQGKFDESFKNLFTALSFKLRAQDKEGVAMVYFRIGNLYFVQRNYTDAERFINRSIKSAQGINHYELMLENYQVLYKIYSQQQKNTLALKSLELHQVYSDSLKHENALKLIEEMSVRFETEKKEKENQLLLRDNEIHTLTILKQKTYTRYLIGVIFLVLIIVLVLIVLFRSKQKTNRIISHKNRLLGEQNTQIAQQNTEIEAKRKDLTDSIEYALRIQEAMLVNMEQLNKVVQDAFILLKPKDIVSGDFYWFTQVQDKVIVAAVDCTGHGVPGAFMSMLGNTLLNQIVLREGITSPEMILERLSEEVQLALKQEETQNQDGMDMAMCVIDQSANTVSYSGAKNPLIIIKNGVAERIKANKKPIGISRYESEKFVKHTIDITEETYFYMFSDGYVDQFGGPKGKKFMVKRFQQLLLDIYQQTMNKQRETLDTTLNNWIQNDEQIDDVLVVGFKLGG